MDRPHDHEIRIGKGDRLVFTPSVHMLLHVRISCERPGVVAIGYPSSHDVELVAPLRVEHVVDPTRVRAREVMDLRGAHDRLTAATGWRPEIPLRQTMIETIEWWEAVLAHKRSDDGLRN